MRARKARRRPGRGRAASGPDGGPVHQHPARPPHQEELEVDQLGRAELIRLGANPDEAIPETPLERAYALPLEAIERVPGRVSLRDHVARELLSPVIVVTLGACEIQLALAAIPRRAPGSDERLHTLIRGNLDGEPARLARDVGAQREQLAAFPGERRRLLPLDATDVDALLEIDRAAARRIESRVPNRHTLHADPRVAVAIPARAAGRAALPAPQRAALENPQEAGIGGVIVLHRAGLAAHEVVAGPAIRGCDLAGKRRRRDQDRRRRGAEGSQRP